MLNTAQWGCTSERQDEMSASHLPQEANELETSLESLAIAVATMTSRESVVPNFRQAAGVKNVYRSSAPDNLADVLGSRHLLECERFILYDVTLLIDLRSPREGDDEKRRVLIERAPGGQFHEINSLEELISSPENRQVLRLTDCALNMPLFVAYVIKIIF
jgi:hypothetical protein